MLRRALASARIEGEFTRIAYVIFGSQLQLLVELTSASSLELAQVSPIFETAVSTFPEAHANRNVDDWLAFLVSSGLITRTHQNVTLTPYGSEFLKFLIDHRLGYKRYG